MENVNQFFMVNVCARLLLQIINIKKNTLFILSHVDYWQFLFNDFAELFFIFFPSSQIFHGIWTISFFCLTVIHKTTILPNASCLLAAYLPATTVLHILLIPNDYPLPVRCQCILLWNFSNSFHCPVHHHRCSDISIGNHDNVLAAKD